MASITEMDTVELRHQMMTVIEEVKPRIDRLKHLARCLPENAQAAEVRDTVTLMIWRLAGLENKVAAL